MLKNLLVCCCGGILGGVVFPPLLETYWRDGLAVEMRAVPQQYEDEDLAAMSL